MATPLKLILVEDDIKLAKGIKTYLQEHHFSVTHISNAERLVQLIHAEKFDMILCDVMLPGANGFEIIKRIRGQFEGPILFMTALIDTSNQLKGFEVGADDYILKPVAPELLLAKLNARFKLHKKPVQEEITFDNLTLDNNQRTAFVNEDILNLTRYEYDLLWLLLNNIDSPLSREFLFLTTIGREYDGIDRTLDSRISRLRKKLDAHAKLACTIKTMWGQGYMLCPKTKAC